MAQINWKTKAEIKAEKNAPQPPTTEEILLTALMEIQALKQKIAELEGE